MGTRFGLSGLIRLALLAGPGMVILAGCASLTTPPTPTNEYQAMANQAVAALGSKWRPVYVEPKDGSLGNYYCKTSRIELGMAGNVRWLLAHEIGHHLSYHCGENVQQEIEANAMAVRVLQVWGDTEAGAALATERHLLGLAKVRKNNPRPGHSYCDEVSDLLERYPATPDVRAGSECVR